VAERVLARPQPVGDPALEALVQWIEAAHPAQVADGAPFTVEFRTVRRS
jgi:hypothetical protein